MMQLAGKGIINHWLQWTFNCFQFPVLGFAPQKNRDLALENLLSRTCNDIFYYEVMLITGTNYDYDEFYLLLL